MFEQTSAILKKNLQITFRNKGELFRQISIPFLTAFVIYSSKYIDFFLVIMLPFYLPISIIGFTRKLLINFVSEKTQKFIEFQKIMGIKEIPLILGWLFSYYIFGIFVEIIILFALWFSGFTKELLFGDVILSFSLFIVASTHQAFAISTIFSKPKIAGEIGTFIITLTGTLYFILAFSSDNVSQIFFYLACLFPQPALSLAIMRCFTSERNSLFLLLKSKLSLKNIEIILFFDIFFYFFLYLYLAQVFPNEYGIKKHPCFCFKNFFKVIYNFLKNPFKLLRSLRRSAFEVELIDIDREYLNSNQQDISSAIFHENINYDNCKASIVIKGLTKYFKNFCAVDNITFNVYESQIFCLLGHNGAGKTTTINMLIGLLQKNSGKVSFENLDLDENLSEIRNILGYCPQHNILYEELTVEEHLKFYARIKGISNILFQNEIDQIIAKCDLESERKKTIKHLSGGNKRKLSLAMSIFSKCNIIFLDEPTAGMDPNTRAKIWEVLNNLRQEKKTIIFTTHYLDEADSLSDRIAIISKGKLLTLGKSDFIKKKFGVGYHLSISTKEDNLEDLENFQKRKNDIAQDIKNNLPNAHQQNNVNPNFLKFILPFESLHLYSDLFKLIEEKYAEFSIDLEMNTLEDAFVNIGLDEEKFFELNNTNIETTTVQNLVETPLPASFHKKPCYNWKEQTKAMFLRKYYMTIRSWTSFFMFLMPNLFILIGVLFGKNLLTEKLPEGLKIFFVSMFVIQGYTFNSSIYIYLIIVEKEQFLKYVLKVTGCRTLPYWFGTFLFDYLAYCLSLLLFFFMIYFSNLDFMTNYIEKVIIIFLLFGFSLITYSYMFSFLFKKSNSAQKFFPLINYFGTYLIPWILIGIFKNNQFLKDASQVLAYVFSPFFVVDRALVSIASNSGFSFGLITEWWMLSIILLAQSILYSYIVIYNDTKKNLLLDKPRNETQNINVLNINQDEAVLAEHQRITERNNRDVIKAVKVEKIYKNGFKALSGISFGVSENEIFGLLGPNGAGKSTTFNILTGLIAKTKGSVHLLNQEFSYEDEEILEKIGVCPQFSALWSKLSVVDHLRLFGRIKGLTDQHLQENIDYYIQSLQLQNDKKKLAQVLSGGTQKKLSVGNALIGGPTLLFLDEPSTGLDPLSKRYLWSTLKKFLTEKKASIILTTHSMIEAEALSYRIGILINGNFACIGTTQQLKNKYGDGYKIEIKTEDQNIAQMFLERFPNAKKEENIVENQTIVFKIKNRYISFSEIFSYLYGELQMQGKIQDFSILQCTLEQIFIYFSKYQENLNDLIVN